MSGRIADDTIDKMTFASIAHTIAGPLANRRYFPSVDLKAAKLLIVVYWGTTRAPAETSGATVIGQRMEQNSPNNAPPTSLPGYDAFKDNWALLQARGQAFSDQAINAQDARILGYESANDPDLRKYRYFVILLAYDMQSYLRDKKQVLLWQTRFSMDEHRNQFDAQLKPMVLEASAYFGRDSLGLRHDPVPEGHVEIGDVKSLGTVPNPESLAALSSDGSHVAYIIGSESEPILAIAGIDSGEFHIAEGLPIFGGQPMQLAWFDAVSVGIKLPSSEVLAFNDQGKRIDRDPRQFDEAYAKIAQSGIGSPIAGNLADILGRKLPERKVTIIGSDVAMERFLIVATAPNGSARVFVYDRANDLLYEIAQRRTGR